MKQVAFDWGKLVVAVVILFLSTTIATKQAIEKEVNTINRSVAVLSEKTARFEQHETRISKLEIEQAVTQSCLSISKEERAEMKKELKELPDKIVNRIKGELRTMVTEEKEVSDNVNDFKKK